MKKNIDRLVPPWETMIHIFEKSHIGLMLFGILFGGFIALIILLGVFHESITVLTGTAPYFATLGIIGSTGILVGGSFLLSYLSSIIIITETSIIIQDIRWPLSLWISILSISEITALRSEKSWFLSLIFWIGKVIIESAWWKIQFFPVNAPNTLINAIDAVRKNPWKNLQK